MSEIKINKEVNEIKESIIKLNLGQVSELIDGLKKDLNIQEEAVIQTTAPAPEAKAEEKGGNVSVKWIESMDEIKKRGLNIIKVFGFIKETIKEVKEEDKNLVQIKNLIEDKEKGQIILEDIPRKKGEDIQEKLQKDYGIKVEIVEIK